MSEDRMGGTAAWLALGLFCPFFFLGGAVESKRQTLFHFDKIEVRGAIKVFLEPGSRNRQIEYFADEQIIETIQAEVRNRTLFLEANNTLGITRRIPLLRLSAQRTFPVEAVVSIDRLSEIRLLDQSSLTARRLASDSLAVFTNSAGPLNLIDLRCQTLEIRQEGSGSVTLKGRETTGLNCTVSGSGSLMGEEFFLDDAVVKHYGSGEVLLAPKRWLDARIEGAGNLYLLEKPLGMVVKESSGGGKVIDSF